ncbi:NEAT domain-containing protein [Clostridium fallax]|uniref:Iron Transport-associated domain-containing protein n=1 Tax=Clostridium fallax TaxID=1533 RepID=A0A1M4XY42_9CLOT|nr:NEAT domain-containing protein [Clostridium fallax]SHE98524.1 Iron Transport-associated domain-containing protein [Clostridium fallax]SQB06483.1 leucine rich repeat domain-containing protein [Clostridium fallax]
MRKSLSKKAAALVLLVNMGVIGTSAITVYAKDNVVNSSLESVSKSDNELKGEKKGLYEVSFKALKENVEEPSMAGGYIEKVNYEVKEDKNQLIFSLDSIDWMQNIKATVDGKEIEPEIKDVVSKENSDGKGNQKGKVIFDVKNLDSKITLHMNVVPMGNARVAFRVILDKNSLSLIKSEETLTKPDIPSNTITDSERPDALNSKPSETAAKEKEELSLEDGLYNVKYKTLKEKENENSMAGGYVEKVTYEVEKEKKYLIFDLDSIDWMTNIKVTVKDKGITPTEIERHKKEENDFKGKEKGKIKFEIDNIENEFMLHMNVEPMGNARVAFRVIPDKSTLTKITSKDEEKPKPSKPLEDGESKPQTSIEDTSLLKDEKDCVYEVSVKALKIDEEKESYASSYLEKTARYEIKDKKKYVTLKLKSGNSIKDIGIEINGQKIDDLIIKEDKEKNSKTIKFQLPDLDSKIKVSGKVSIIFFDKSVEFRVVPDKNTLKELKNEIPTGIENENPLDSISPSGEVVKPTNNKDIEEHKEEGHEGSITTNPEEKPTEPKGAEGNGTVKPGEAEDNIKDQLNEKKLEDGVYTLGFKAYRIDRPNEESMLGGFFDKNIKVEVENGNIILTWMNLCNANMLYDFMLESNGKYERSISNPHGEPNATGEYFMQTFKMPVSDLDKDHLVGVLVSAMGGQKNDIGNPEKYTKARIVFNKDIVKGWNGFETDNNVKLANIVLNEALLNVGADKDGDGNISNEEISNLSGEVDLSSSDLSDISKLYNLGDKVTSLYLNGNKIKELPKGIFDKMVNLENLYLNGNLIENLPDGIFDKLTKLKVLGLSTNKIKNIPKGTFDKLNNLTELDLGKNNLTKLDEDVFIGLKNIDSLSLSENNIEELPDNIFKYNNTLRLLFLYDNNLNKVPKSIGGLDRLESLSLNNNKIEILPEELKNLNNLNSLNISKNYIKEISEDLFSIFKNMNSIDLSDNNISSIPDNLIDILPNLKYLNLKLNNIKKLPNLNSDWLKKYKDYLLVSPQKSDLGLKLTVKDGLIKWTQDLSALDLLYWDRLRGNESPKTIEEYKNKLKDKSIVDILNDKDLDWTIITELQKKDESGNFVTINKVSTEELQDEGGSYEDKNMKEGDKYRLIKTVYSSVGSYKMHKFSYVLDFVAKNSGLIGDKQDEPQVTDIVKPEESKEKDGLYEVKVDSLKENNDEKSMAGSYVENVNYEVKDGKKYMEVSLDSIDWMKDIVVTVDGKDIKPEIKDLLDKTVNDGKGKKKGKIRFEVKDLNSKITLHMNVEPMGNARVAFRMVPEKESLKLIDNNSKPSSEILQPVDNEKPDIIDVVNPEEPKPEKPIEEPEIPAEKEAVKDGYYKVSVKTLKNNSNENSMAGAYVKKVNYEVKNGKKYIEVSLDSIDWMKNLVITVDGKNIKPSIVYKVKKDKADGKGTEKGKIRFEVKDLNSKITLHMNVEPMGNARVAFRLVLNSESLVLDSKEVIKPSPEVKTEEKPDIIDVVSPEEEPKPKPEVPVEEPEAPKEEEKPVIDTEKEATYEIKNDIDIKEAKDLSIVRKYLKENTNIEVKDKETFIVLNFSNKTDISKLEITIDDKKTNFDVISNNNLVRAIGENSLKNINYVNKSSNLKTVRFKVPNLESKVKVKLYDNDSKNNVTFGLKLKGNTLKEVSNNNDNNLNLNDSVKPEENKEKDGLYEVKVDSLKENNDEKSMSGSYIENVNYEVKDGKKYIEASLDSIDWMKNIVVTVDGKDIKPEIKDLLDKPVNDGKGKKKGKIRFEVKDLNSKITLHMNVEPMGNARVAFRMVPKKDTLKLIKEEVPTIGDNENHSNVPDNEVKPTENNSNIKNDNNEGNTNSKDSNIEKPVVSEVVNKEDNLAVDPKENKEKDGLYEISMKTLKENSDEPSMAGAYLGDKAKVEMKNGKKYVILTLNRSDWMDNIEALVNGKKANYDVLNVKSLPNGEKTSTIRFEVPDLTSPITLKMNVKPMGNERVAFRVLLNKDSLKYLKNTNYDPKEAEEYLDKLAEDTKDKVKETNSTKESSNKNNIDSKKISKEKKLPKTGVSIGGGIMATIGSIVSALGLALMKNKKRGN